MGSGVTLFNSEAAGRIGRVFLLLAAWVAMAVPAVAQEPVDPTVLPELIDARLSTTEERARLILDLSGPTEFPASGARPGSGTQVRT